MHLRAVTAFRFKFPVMIRQLRKKPTYTRASGFAFASMHLTSINARAREQFGASELHSKSCVGATTVRIAQGIAN